MAVSAGLMPDYPDVSFIENYTAADLEEDMIAWFKEKKAEIDGEAPALPMADGRRMLLSACAYYLYLGYKYVDISGKMMLLKYSAGKFLDNLGALKGVSRLPSAGAAVTLRYWLATARESATGIPQGSRATAGDGVYFATDGYAEIPAGETYADVAATCTSAGADGNLYAAGEINTMADIVPFVDGVENVAAPSGGRGEEGDDDLRERIYLAPSGYSVAGPEDAYKYHARSCSAAIGDVEVSSPAPCEVEVRFLLSDGSLPTEELLAEVGEYLSADDRRPLTDKVTVLAPEAAEFDIALTYWINRSDAGRAASIQAAVAGAVDEYAAWQTGKIGRDVNPSALVQMVMAAGAKRIEIASPSYAAVPKGRVPREASRAVTYGGMEDG